MEKFIRALLSPTAFAIGFLWPLVAQSLVATSTVEPGVQAYLIGALVVAPFAIMAQVRGSWIWIK